MNRRLFTLTLSVLLVTSVFSQKWKLMRYELQGGVGFTNVVGDVGGAATRNNWFGVKDFSITGTGPSLYLGGSYKLDRNMNLKAAFVFGTARGNDAGSLNDARQYTFSTKIIEPSISYEYYFLSEVRPGNSGLFDNRGFVTSFSRISAYVFTGLGGAIVMPKLNTNGRQLSTQYQEKTVSNTFSPVIPLGIGLKYSIGAQRFIGFEFGGRYAFSDYIDGLTNRMSKHNDVYYTGSLFLIYKIKNDRSGKPRLIWKRF